MAKRDMQSGTVRFHDFDEADRMRRALRVSGMGVSAVAEALGVERNTVGNWINGHIVPRKTSLMAFALATGAPYEWLAHGTVEEDPEPSGPVTETESGVTRL